NGAAIRPLPRLASTQTGYIPPAPLPRRRPTREKYQRCHPSALPPAKVVPGLLKQVTAPPLCHPAE
ncbi:MAG: hypothetical protein WCZ16_14425, partial [Desulfosarcinaceae bacterium]